MKFISEDIFVVFSADDFAICFVLIITKWQARKDSNLQPPVLETSALPIEPRTCVKIT